MIFFDCTRLYEVGLAIQSAKEITGDTTHNDAFYKAYQARSSLLNFLQDESYKDSIKIMQDDADKLVGELLKLFQSRTEENGDTPIGLSPYIDLLNATRAFEHVFKAEIRNWNTFITPPAGAYDVKTLIEDGDRLITRPSFARIFPNAVDDIKAGARCLAFDLFTASALHFHRANESVVLHYMDHLRIDREKLRKRNLSEYVSAIKKEDAPKPIVSCLQDLAELSRNPLMHPEDTIETYDEADAVFCRIKAVIISILREIE